MAHSLLFTILFVFTLSASAQNTANITVAASLTATETSIPWRSPSGDFAFGFQQLQDNNDLFILSIWFDKIPTKTIVWFERKSYPVPRGSTVRLDATYGLVLRGPRGNLLYITDGLGDEVAYGFLNDTGNLVLFRTDSSSMWESFRDPSDTILPTQIIEIDGSIVSRKTETNFSEGRFIATMDNTGY